MDDRAVLSALLRGEPAPAELDWHALLPAAIAHGLLGMLAEQFQAHAPGPTRPALAAQRLGQLRVQALQQEVLATLSVPVVLLKGPALSERLYGDGTRRASRDLDLLIDPADLEQVLADLHSLGFAEMDPSSGIYLRQHHHHVSLGRAHTPPVEVHFRLLTGFGTTLPAGEFLQRSVPYGEWARVLSPEDEFFYLAVHAAQHLCGRLIWLEDLRRLRLQQPALQWDAIQERAARFRVRRALAFTLTALDGQPKLLDVFQRIEHTSLPEPTRELFSQTLLCDNPARAAAFAAHHSGRLLRRRWQRWFPRWAPAEWAS